MYQSRRDWFAKFCRLDDEFSVKYNKIKTLPGIRDDGKGGGVSDDDLMYQLSEVIYVYRKRHKDDTYFNNIRQGACCANDAARLIDEVAKKISKLDLGHKNAFLNIMACCRGEMGDSSTSTLASTICEAKRLFELSGAALGSLITGKDYKHRGRGRPTVPYVEPTIELMMAWKILTDRSPVMPKGRVVGSDGQMKFSQPSTEFVRLGLSIIDERVSMSNVETSIKKVFALQKMLARQKKGDEMSPIPLSAELLIYLDRLASKVSIPRQLRGGVRFWF